MLKMTRVATTMAGLMITMVGFAQAPSGAPAGSTGQCRDGTYWSGVVKKGACHGHKGVQTWYGDAAAAGASNAAGTTSTAAGAAAAPAPAAASPPPSAAPTATPSATSKAAAPGGGAGQVWINKNTKVYHCSTDKWYGKTKNGAYVSEAEAKAQGFHPDHGKACQ
jgi:hypothetical protein